VVVVPGSVVVVLVEVVVDGDVAVVVAASGSVVVVVVVPPVPWEHAVATKASVATRISERRIRTPLVIVHSAIERQG